MGLTGRLTNYIMDARADCCVLTVAQWGPNAFKLPPFQRQNETKLRRTAGSYFSLATDD